MALPALVYATDWLLYIGMLMIPAVAPLAIYGAAFFRRIDATSAYEYLGKRFSRSVRLFGGLYAVPHFAHGYRDGTTTSLSAITPLTAWQSVLTGSVVLIYCTLGELKR